MVSFIKSKRGIIRIIEAFIAVLIIASVMIFIYTTQIQKPDQSERVDKVQTIILEKISEDQALRQAVLDETINTINQTIASLMPEDFAFLFKICELDEICGLDYGSDYYTKNNIYVKEKSISSTLAEYNPRKLKLFVWVKQ